MQPGLHNAAQHNVDGGVVRVRTGADDRGAAYVLVENTGDVVPAELAATLVEPFVRGAGRVRSARGPTGSGLGLSIVASIARAHGAGLAVGPREGGGLVVQVTFSGPAA